MLASTPPTAREAICLPAFRATGTSAYLLEKAIAFYFQHYDPLTEKGEMFSPHFSRLGVVTGDLWPRIYREPGPNMLEGGLTSDMAATAVLKDLYPNAQSLDTLGWVVALRHNWKGRRTEKFLLLCKH